jgi:hypothetical protein
MLTSVGAEAYGMPYVHDGDTMWTILQREGAEKHATMVEKFYATVIVNSTTGATRSAADVQIFLARDSYWDRYADLFRKEGWFSNWLQ